MLKPFSLTQGTVLCVASTGTPYVGHYTLAIANSHLSKTATGNSNYGQAVTGFTEGKYYTFSAFVKTTNVSPVGVGGLEGAYLQISATGGTENETGYSQVLTGTTETSINNGWRRLTATVQVPEDTTNLTVYMCLRNANGYVYFDGTQVEEGTTPNAVNLLLNSSFEAESNGLPVGWAKRGTADYATNSSGTVLTGVTSAAHKDGAKSLIISGSPEAYKGFSQSIPVQGNPNDTYILSGWAAAYAVNSTYHSHYEIDGEEPTDDELKDILQSADKEDDKTLELVEDSKFEIAVTVYYNKTDKNGNTQTEPVPQDKDPVKFNTTIANWQYASTPIVLKYEKEAGDECTYTPTSIEIMPRYNQQANYAYFDHIQLIKDVAQSYVYDKEGNLVSVSANAEQKNNMTYDGEDNLTEYYDAGYNKTTFEYQEGTHNLTKVTSPKGVKTEYTYNTMGQVLATETTNPAGNYSIKTSVNLSDAADGISARAYIESDFDQNGYRT
ncbi:MAG: hypothetical protein J6D06_03075, partial [Clostridia bacterium]|nr:hypothetical protein [Clostridia bacterium]